MAKHRNADWQIDLRPVTLAPKSESPRRAGENGQAPHADHATSTDAALLNTLTAVTAAVTELSRAVEVMGKRLDGLESATAAQAATTQALAGQLLTQAAAAASSAAAPATAPPSAAPTAAPPADKPARPVRPTTRALRGSTTAPLERRTRRAAPPAEAKPASDETPEPSPGA
ncbi:MAG TPA: hypothetical protein VG708_10235 [Mycobacteriales bacterium]|nr:hypothetical protein [Mycobacteriales bacterium]